jgi:hypothetical protein
MSDCFRVERWSGRNTDEFRLLYETPLLELAESIMLRVYRDDDMRQGVVRVVAPDGSVARVRWAPNLRTRW